MPNLRHFDMDRFSRQLDSFAASGRLITRAQFFDALELKRDVEDGIVLTFDDGTMDHSEHVVPELLKRGLWGFFFIPSGPYLSGKLLGAHRIHCLMAMHDAGTILSALRRLVPEDSIDKARRARFAHTYDHQDSPLAEKEIKLTLNYYLEESDRERLLDALVAEFLDEGEVVKKFYLSTDRIKAMHDAGMVIGAHSVTHRLLARLSVGEQEGEIVRSLAFVEDVTGGLPVRTFAYPYGIDGSYNAASLALLDKHGVSCAFTTEPRAINADDLARPLVLPRLNCISIPA